MKRILIALLFSLVTQLAHASTNNPQLRKLDERVMALEEKEIHPG